VRQFAGHLWRQGGRIRNRFRFPTARIGRRTSIDHDSILGRNVGLGSDVVLNAAEVGDYSYLGPRCVVVNARIGRFCSIASEVHVGLGIHPLEPFVSTHPALYLSRPSFGWDFADGDYRSEYGRTEIGNDVWLGLRAAIKDGVTVHDGAVVAAGAVVVDDVAPYAIVGGVPAKVIRYRFTPEIIDFLMSLKWWDKSEEWLREHWKQFHEVEALIRSLGVDLKMPLARSGQRS